jgi:salicylate hydroxylase
MFNQVAVFESPTALAGDEDWGTPDELDAAFAHTCGQVQQGMPLMWRDRWWRMFDRDPIDNWVHGRIALLGDAAHPPLQYMAQGAIMAIEDGWVLAEHVGAERATRTAGSGVEWDAVLSAYNAVRPEHCRRVVTTARSWGELWHLEGLARQQRNAILRERDTYDYTYTEWIFGPTALTPEEEPAPYPTRSLASVDIPDTSDGDSADVGVATVA